MYGTLIVTLIVTIAELILTKFSLWFVIACIARLMFSMRFFGAMFRPKHIFTFEGIAIACKLVWNMTMHKGSIDWVNFGIFVLCAIISILVVIYDNAKYVYTTEDDDDDL